MRNTLLVLLLFPVLLGAQPQYPDLTFTVVRNAKGKHMRGSALVWYPGHRQ